MSKVNWIKWSDEKPESTGVYLTYWSDKALETYSVGIYEIHKDTIMSENSILLYWAENVDPPIGNKG